MPFISRTWELTNEYSTGYSRWLLTKYVGYASYTQLRSTRPCRALIEAVGCGVAINFTICKQGETRPGKAIVVLERGHTTVVIKEVPANIRENCGLNYLN